MCDVSFVIQYTLFAVKKSTVNANFCGSCMDFVIHGLSFNILKHKGKYAFYIMFLNGCLYSNTFRVLCLTPRKNTKATCTCIVKTQ